MILNTQKIKSRWSAFGIHLIVSIFIFICLALIIRLWWYPGVLFATEGGWQGIKLIAGVDLIIGPLLTLLVYNTQKKELPRDLAIIAALQIAALSYGMYLVERNRPISIIYFDSIFWTSTRNQYDSNYIDIKTVPTLQNTSWPVWIAVNLPENNQQKSETIRREFNKDIRVLTNLYQPFEENAAKWDNQGIALQEFMRNREQSVREFTKYAEQKHLKVFYLITRYGTYYLLADTPNKQFISVHQIN